VWGMQLKHHTIPCGCGNSLFTGRVCRGYPTWHPIIGCRTWRCSLLMVAFYFFSSVRPFSYFPAPASCPSCLLEWWPLLIRRREDREQHRLLGEWEAK
jgi:hypothetical protein